MNPIHAAKTYQEARAAEEARREGYRQMARLARRDANLARLAFYFTVIAVVLMALVAASSLESRARYAAQAAGTNTNQPALAAMELRLAGGTLSLRCKNLDIEAEARLNADGEWPDTVRVNARDFISLLSRTRDNTILTVQDGGIDIASNGVKAQIPTLPEILPTGTIGENASRGEIEDFAVDRVAFASAKTAGRYALSGVLVELCGKQASLVASDKARIAIHTCEYVGTDGENHGKWILNQSGAKAAPRGMVNFAGDANAAEIEMGPETIRTQLVDGNFPSYSNVMPAGDHRQITAPREAWIEALQNAIALADTETKQVKLCGRIIKTDSPRGQVNAMIPDSFSDTTDEISVNAKYLLDGMRHASEDAVMLEIYPNDGKLLICEGNWTYLLQALKQENR